MGNNKVITKMSKQEIKELKEKLIDLKIFLHREKINNSFISKTKLKSIIDQTKNEASSLVVEREIDKLFEEYFANTNDMNYNDGENKGVSKIKRDKNHFKTERDDNKVA